MRKRPYISIGVLLVVISLIAIYCCMYYPKQSMPVGEQILVITPDSEKYHNDCLHPCIRYEEKSGKYYMAQSPYYGWNNEVENPMYYVSEDFEKWNNGILISDTPKKGYNSDPCVYVEDSGKVYYIWRECFTHLCDSIGCKNTTVGGYVVDGIIKDKHVLCSNNSSTSDIEQCPILMKHNGVYYIYAAWYQYELVRKNKGIAIWKGTSLENPDFELQDTISFESIYTVDKCAQVRLNKYIYYIPKPQWHDMWHFDLFDYDGKLYMVSVAEKGDNIMLSVADDWVHFKTYRKPLVNNHYTENYCGYRQYYYKPSAFVKDDTLHLFYTANDQYNPSKNILFHAKKSIKAY